MDEKDCPEKTDIAKKTIFAEIASITNSTIGTYQMLSADKLTCLTDFDYSVKYLGPDAKAPEMIKFNGKTRQFTITSEFGGESGVHYYQLIIDHDKEDIKFSPEVKIGIGSSFFPYFKSTIKPIELKVFKDESGATPEVVNKNNIDYKIKPK